MEQEVYAEQKELMEKNVKRMLKKIKDRKKDGGSARNYYEFPED